MEISVVRQAFALAETERQDEAVELLRRAQSAGKAVAFYVEGLWQLEGRFVPRDLTAARRSFAQAADAGHSDGARILSALTARGVGAPADWPGAIAILQAWVGRDPVAARQLDLIAAMRLDPTGNPEHEFDRAIRSESPHIVRIERFLSPDECAFLTELADPRMRRSTVFDRNRGRFVEDPVRTSDLAAFPVILEWPFVRAINQRLARATGTPVECGEALQVLRYRPGQEFRPHCDSSAELENQRVMTAVIWLNADFEGGETHFDLIGLTERPAQGDLLFFSNVLADHSPNIRSRHAGLPVVSGTKYLASRWIRAHPMNGQGFGVRGLNPAEIA